MAAVVSNSPEVNDPRIPLAAFAFLRVFLGAVWLFELVTGAPWAEFTAAIGVLLVAGLFTPPAALAGAVLTAVVYGQSGSSQAWGVWPWLYWLLMLMHALVAFTRSGRAFGLDSILAGWRRRWPIW